MGSSFGPTVIRAISERFGEFSEDSVLLVNGEPECCMPLSGYTARKFTRVIDEPLSLSYFLFFQFYMRSELARKCCNSERLLFILNDSYIATTGFSKCTICQ